MRILTPEKLRRLRRWKGWTQARVAALLGVSTNTVARWERYEVTMPDWPARVLARHIRAFDVATDRWHAETARQAGRGL